MSRLLALPLGIIVQSNSAAGKTLLVKKVLALIPEEAKVMLSALTPQSLYYLGELDIRHKVLSIDEEEGASKASYPLKVLHSEGELSIASTGKDPKTGELQTSLYKVVGPISPYSTSTSNEIDEEMQNRCITLTVDESREQTRAIHRYQREMATIEGLRKRKRRGPVTQLHHDVQRLLGDGPVDVHVPYARDLTFMDAKTRMRRDQQKYLTLIQAITLLHRYQRKIQREEDDGLVYEYILATREDVALANELANEVLGRSLSELSPQTQGFLRALHAVVTKECERQQIARSAYRFRRRHLLQWTGLSMTQVRRHLACLVEHEYVLVHRGRNGMSYEYELLYNGEGDDRDQFMLGLIDVDKIPLSKAERSTTRDLAGSEGNLAPTLPPPCHDLAPTLPRVENRSKAKGDKASREVKGSKAAENRTWGDIKTNPEGDRTGKSDPKTDPETGVA